MPVPTLTEVKAALTIPETDEANDPRLQGIIDAAVEKVADLCGPLEPVDVVEDHRIGRRRGYAHEFYEERHPQDEDLLLRVWPVLSVQTVTCYPGATVVPEIDIVTGTDGYELDLVAGVLSYPYFGTHVRVAYRAGRETVPAGLVEAIEILVDHLWRRAKNRVGVGQRTVYGGADPEKTSPFPAGFAMPKAASELLEYHLKPAGLGA